MVPMERPLYRAPWAWAQSSITFSPCFFASVRMESMSAGWPYRCTGMTAFVFPVIFASIVVDVDVVGLGVDVDKDHLGPRHGDRF